MAEFQVEADVVMVSHAVIFFLLERKEALGFSEVVDGSNVISFCH